MVDGPPEPLEAAETPGSARRRVPPPRLAGRMPSGRGAMEQPNVTSDGDASLSPRFWIAIVATGVAAGLLGAAMMAILFGAQHLAFDYHSGSLAAAAARASGLRRVGSLVVAGVFGGVAWYFLRRYTSGEKSDVDDAIWNGSGELSFRRSFGTAVISEVVIGMGASIGREAAPKLMGGASGTLVARWLRLSPGQRRLLVACGAGAGLAAVYNVPLGGALFTAEILCGSLTLPVILPALACSAVATAVAWIYLPSHASYLDIPSYRFSISLLVWSVVAGVVIGLLATAYIRLIGWVGHHQAKGRAVLVAPVAAFAILGVIGLRYPQLFGNGKDMAHMAFLGSGGAALLFALFALKPLVTSLCLSSGASGGLFTPFLSTGAVLGGFLGIAWVHLWPGTPIGAFAMIGAAAMIGSSMQAPLVGLALVLEMTHSGFQLMVPMMTATVISTVVSRHIDGYSIYTARLAPSPSSPASL